MTYRLVLLRHGQSVWNAKNLFTGWVDVGLTDVGEAEARRGGELLAERDYLPDVVHTSVMRRAIRTAEITLDLADRLRSEEHTSELQSRGHLVCRLLLEKKKPN